MGTHEGDEDHASVPNQVKEGLDLSKVLELALDLGRRRVVLQRRRHRHKSASSFLLDLSFEMLTYSDVSDKEGPAGSLSLDTLLDQTLVLLVLERLAGSAAHAHEPASTTVCRNERPDGREPEESNETDSG